MDTICECLTRYDGGQQLHRLVWRNAVRIEWLQQILGECESGNCITSWHENEKGCPEVEEGWQSAEGHTDVGVIATGLGDHCS